MKARDARALVRRLKALIAVDAHDEIVTLVETDASSLRHSKVRNAYSNALLELGHRERAEAVLLESARTDPQNLFALRVLVDFDKADASMSVDEASLAELRDGVGLVRRAALLLRLDRAEEAFQAGHDAIHTLADPAQRSCARRSLAGLFLWRGRLDLAERLLLAGRGGDELLATLSDLVSLRTDAVHDEETLTWFRFLVESPLREQASIDYFDYLWSTRGANQALVDLGAALQRQLPEGDVELRTRRIALAHELGQRDEAVALLREHPACASSYSSVLPIARLLRDEPSLQALRSSLPDETALVAKADLYDHIASTSRTLAERVTDKSVRVAVVGNSGCETGKGRGREVDAHDIVIRFNAAPNHDGFRADYGSRTDVHVLPARGSRRRPPAADARVVLFTSPDLLARNRNWGHAEKLRHLGKDIACVRGQGSATLIRKLEAPPSNGLRVLAYLHSLRGSLRRESLFGFSFVDQIGPNSASSHYYEKTRPSMHHKWEKELELLESMLET